MPKRSLRKAREDRPPFLKLFESFGSTYQLNGSVEAVAEECPFCGKENHCYLNIEKGQYDCKSCGESGNAYTFIRHVHQEALDSTTDKQYHQIKRLRGLPLQTLKRHGIAFHQETDNWLIPFMSEKGEPNNLLRWELPVGKSSGGKYNLPGLKVCLYGLNKLSDDPDRTLYLCEGAMDAIALDQHFRSKKVRPRYDILAVPGANIFNPEWEVYFRGRKVRIVYDNDEAGRSGQDKFARCIIKVATEVRKLIWPVGTEEGYDISDFIRDGGN